MFIWELEGMFLLIGIKGTPAGGKRIWDRDHKLGSQPTSAEDKKIGKVEIVPGIRDWGGSFFQELCMCP